MSDIVDRLRANARSEDCLYDMDPGLLNGAAEEIERLRAALESIDAYKATSPALDAMMGRQDWPSLVTTAAAPKPEGGA